MVLLSGRKVSLSQRGLGKREYVTWNKDRTPGSSQPLKLKVAGRPLISHREWVQGSILMTSSSPRLDARSVQARHGGGGAHFVICQTLSPAEISIFCKPSFIWGKKGVLIFFFYLCLFSEGYPYSTSSFPLRAEPCCDRIKCTVKRPCEKGLCIMLKPAPLINGAIRLWNPLH